MKPRFTPGPWEWDGLFLKPVQADPDAQSIHTILELGEWSGTGYLAADRTKRQAEDQANLKLIVQAPMLYTALDRLVTALPEGSRPNLVGAVQNAMATLTVANPGWWPR